MTVISVCPAGRRRYLEVLVPYLLQNRDVIDRHHWWVNTTDAGDLAYLEGLAAEHPDFFVLCRSEVDRSMSVGANIWRFFKTHAEPGTIYVRLDDDLLWLDRDAVRNLVEFRTANPEPFLVYGNIVNNAVCTHFHQKAGLVPTSWGVVGNNAFDELGWIRGPFAARLHRLFLRDLESGATDRWKDVELPIAGTRVASVNFIAWNGADMAGVPEIHVDPMEEELFLTTAVPTRLGRPNAACPDALVAHYAFFTQRDYLERAARDILPRYRRIAENDGLPLRSAGHWSHGVQDGAAAILSNAKWSMYNLERDVRRRIKGSDKKAA